MAVVPAQLARECMEQYEQVMNGNDLTRIHDAFTASVTFLTPEYSAWISGYLLTTDSIRISFGVYTANACAQLGIPGSEGRLTAFVWPIAGTQEFEPFNVGQTEP